MQDTTTPFHHPSQIMTHHDNMTSPQTVTNNTPKDVTCNKTSDTPSTQQELDSDNDESLLVATMLDGAQVSCSSDDEEGSSLMP